MRSVPLKSTLTPASSRGPAEASPELATFFTCKWKIVVTVKLRALSGSLYERNGSGL